MKLEILGSGGASVVPRPFCMCAACTEARLKGAPYTRLGPSVFIHDLSLLIDTPEEIAIQVNRAQIMQVEHVLYTHWHPDHTAGMRLFESNLDRDREWQVPPSNNANYCTKIILPEIVAQTFAQYHDLQNRFAYIQRLGGIVVHTIPNRESFTIKDTVITPFVLFEDYACGFILEEQRTGKRVLICMDETFGWEPPASLGQFDLALIPAGMFEFHPLTDERVIPADHPILRREATFDQVLNTLPSLDAKRIVFIHLNEGDRLTFAEYKQVADRINHGRRQGLTPIEFAYDTMKIYV